MRSWGSEAMASSFDGSQGASGAAEDAHKATTRTLTHSVVLGTSPVASINRSTAGRGGPSPAGTNFRKPPLYLRTPVPTQVCELVHARKGGWAVSGDRKLPHMPPLHRSFLSGFGFGLFLAQMLTANAARVCAQVLLGGSCGVQLQQPQLAPCEQVTHHDSNGWPWPHHRFAFRFLLWLPLPARAPALIVAQSTCLVPAQVPLTNMQVPLALGAPGLAAKQVGHVASGSALMACYRARGMKGQTAAVL